jgi:hypothetical protein
VTNREILRASRDILSNVDRQKQFLLRVEGTLVPCPICTEPCNVFDAANIDIDAYDFGQTQLSFHCPTCGIEVEQIVPFLAVGNSWHWEVKSTWLQKQVQKARPFDEQLSDKDNRAT